MCRNWCNESTSFWGRILSGPLSLFPTTWTNNALPWSVLCRYWVFFKRHPQILDLRKSAALGRENGLFSRHFHRDCGSRCFRIHKQGQGRIEAGGFVDVDFKWNTDAHYFGASNYFSTKDILMEAYRSNDWNGSPPWNSTTKLNQVPETFHERSD